MLNIFLKIKSTSCCTRVDTIFPKVRGILRSFFTTRHHLLRNDASKRTRKDYPWPVLIYPGKNYEKKNKDCRHPAGILIKPNETKQNSLPHSIQACRKFGVTNWDSLRQQDVYIELRENWSTNWLKS
jgi:hypothetical protein